ncbi:MAG: hypothetical protein ACI4JX_01195 [Oscillospiraceae bacterium]
MSEQRYSIMMKTPLGSKYGVLGATVSENALSGWLDVLGHREPFEGTIDSTGNCSIKGTLVTLMSTVHFIATGKLTASGVSLQICCGHNVFELTGVSCSGGGEAEKCENSIPEL